MGIDPTSWSNKAKVAAAIGSVAVVGIVAFSASGSDENAPLLRNFDNEAAQGQVARCLLPPGLNVCQDYNVTMCGTYPGCQVDPRDGCVVRPECECYDLPPLGCEETSPNLCPRYEGCLFFGSECLKSDEPNCFSATSRPIVNECALPETQEPASSNSEPFFCSSYSANGTRCVGFSGCEYVDNLCALRDSCVCSSQPQNGCSSVVGGTQCIKYGSCQLNVNTGACDTKEECLSSVPTNRPTTNPGQLTCEFPDTGPDGLEASAPFCNEFNSNPAQCDSFSACEHLDGQCSVREDCVCFSRPEEECSSILSGSECVSYEACRINPLTGACTIKEACRSLITSPPSIPPEEECELPVVPQFCSTHSGKQASCEFFSGCQYSNGICSLRSECTCFSAPEDSCEEVESGVLCAGYGVCGLNTTTGRCQTFLDCSIEEENSCSLPEVPVFCRNYNGNETGCDLYNGCEYENGICSVKSDCTCSSAPEDSCEEVESGVLCVGYSTCGIDPATGLCQTVVDCPVESDNCTLPEVPTFCRNYNGNETGCDLYNGCEYENGICSVKSNCTCSSAPEDSCEEVESGVLCVGYSTCGIDPATGLCQTVVDCPVEGDNCTLPEAPTFCPSYDGNQTACLNFTGCEYANGLCTLNSECTCASAPEDSCEQVENGPLCAAYGACTLDISTGLCTTVDECVVEDDCVLPAVPNFCRTYDGNATACDKFNGCEYENGICSVIDSCKCASQPDDGCASETSLPLCVAYNACEINPRSGTCSLLAECVVQDDCAFPVAPNFCRSFDNNETACNSFSGCSYENGVCGVTEPCRCASQPENGCASETSLPLCVAYDACEINPRSGTCSLQADCSQSRSPTAAPTPWPTFSPTDSILPGSPTRSPTSAPTKSPSKQKVGWG